MNAPSQGDQRREEKAGAEEEAPEETSEAGEDSGHIRFLMNSVDLRLAMIPGFLEYKEAYYKNSTEV